MNKTFLAVLAVIAATTLTVTDVADAKRLGGGRSFGAQRQMTPPPAAPAPAPKVAPTTPPQAAAPTAPAAAGAAAAAPARSGMSRWLGPIAGIAAGLGLAALLSHFGLSEGFAGLLLIALVVIGGVFLVRMLFARRTPANASPLAYAGNAPGRVEPTMGQAPPRFEPVMGDAPSTAPAVAPVAGKFPPGFDPQPFAEQAKRQFMRMQAAYDAADRKALADVMTPEMFAEVSGELANRGAHLPTEVRDLAAQVLEVTTEGNQHWMSVRFTGLLREDGTVLPKEFDEIWNLSKPVDDSSGWMLAGIQQNHALA